MADCDGTYDFNEIPNFLNELKKGYDALKKDKQSLLDIIFEAELPESVYNSNAIEGSTLTKKETESKIIVEVMIMAKLFPVSHVKRPALKYERAQSYLETHSFYVQ